MGSVRSVLCLALGLPLAAFAAFDLRTPTDWSGTAYRGGGWFSYRMGQSACDGSPAFADEGSFLLSPRFAAPIRRVALRLSCTSLSPTRRLCLAPLADGVERGALSADGGDAESGAERTVVFDLPAEERIDAVRLFADTGGTGVWSVASLCVFTGPATSADEAELAAFRATPSAPRNLRIDDFSLNALTLRADVPQDAVACRVDIDRLDGVPLTEVREDFVDAPETSGDGWTVSASNAALDRYTGVSSTDVKTAGDETAMRIAKDENGAAGSPVRVEVVSPTFPGAVREYSFVCKRSSGESSDLITVYGATDGSDEWTALGDSRAVETGMRWITNAVSTACGIVRVKFVFTADYATCRPCALDTLRVVYGGDQTRVPVLAGAAAAADGSFVTNGLPTARYAVRMAAVGANGRESRPSCEQVVDLSWAQAAVTAPQQVAAAVETKGLAVRWQAVTDADHYLVTVTKAGEQTEPFACERRVTATSVVLTELDGVGDYAVTVTAVAPGGKSTAAAETVPVTIAPGQVGKVTAAATDLETIEASWSAVPFAEGYQVTVIGLNGVRRTVRTVRTRQSAVTVGGLSCEGLYQLCVCALPLQDETPAAESEPIDMTRMKPRIVAPVSLKSLHDEKCYAEDFSSLAAVRSGVDIHDLDLPHWQVRSAGVEPRRLMQTTNGSTSVGGVFVVSDADRSVSSFMLATHANGNGGARIGVAFTNDGLSAVCNLALSFDSVQRSFTKEPKTHTVECLLTAGETDLDANGEWRALPAEDTAPVAEGSPKAQAGECRRRQGPLPLEGFVILPGQALIVRWRDDARASSPMMGVDNVRLTFDTQPAAGMKVFLK